MSFDLVDVTIAIFDIHTVPNAVGADTPEYYNPRFTFLHDPGLFRNTHRQLAPETAPLLTPSLACQTLLKLYRGGKFWDSYLQIRHDRALTVDEWKLQLPFVCRPRRSEVRVNVPIPNADVSMSTSI